MLTSSDQKKRNNCVRLLVSLFSVLGTRSSVSAFTALLAKPSHIFQPFTSLHMFFNFQDDPILIPQQHYDNLIQCNLPKAPIEIRKSELGHGFGLYCTQDVPSGITLFTVPKEQCITLDDVRSHPDLGKVLTIMQDDAAEGEGRIFGNIASLSAYLASEWLMEECAEWEEDPSLAGKYGPYLKTLPSGRGVSEQDHILWWKEDELNTIFKKGVAFDKAESLREWVEAEAHIIQGMLVSDLAQKGMGLSISQVSKTINNSFVNVLNRGMYFEENGEQVQRLCPVLDMCAHSNDPNLSYFDDKGDVVVKTIKPIKVGDELSVSYYSNEFEGHEFYVMFGFVPNKN